MFALTQTRAKKHSWTNRHTYTTWPKVCGHLLVEHLIPKSWELIWSWAPFTAITASTLLERLSTRCWNIAARTCFHSATSALVRSGTVVGLLGLVRSRRSNSSQRCSKGLRSVQASQVLPHRSWQTISVWTSLCAHGHCHAETGKGFPQTVVTKL